MPIVIKSLPDLSDKLLLQNLLDLLTDVWQRQLQAVCCYMVFASVLLLQALNYI